MFTPRESRVVSRGNRKDRWDMGLEWFVSAVLAATGIAVFGYFEEKTPLWRRLSK